MPSRSLSFQKSHKFVALSRLNITKLDLMGTHQHKGLWLCVHFLSSQLCNEAQKWHAIQNAFLQLLSIHKNYHAGMVNKKCTHTACCIGNTHWDQLSSLDSGFYPLTIPRIQASGWIKELVFHLSSDKPVKQNRFLTNYGFIFNCWFPRVFYS